MEYLIRTHSVLYGQKMLNILLREGLKKYPAWKVAELGSIWSDLWQYLLSDYVAFPSWSLIFLIFLQFRVNFVLAPPQQILYQN